jgi:hypothetical protein
MFLFFVTVTGIVFDILQHLSYDKSKIPIDEDVQLRSIIFFNIGGAVLSPWVCVQVPRYLLVPGTAATLAYCTNPDDR